MGVIAKIVGEINGFEKFDPYHDEQGKFSSSDESGSKWKKVAPFKGGTRYENKDTGQSVEVFESHVGFMRGGMGERAIQVEHMDQGFHTVSSKKFSSSNTPLKPGETLESKAKAHLSRKFGINHEF